MVKASQTAARPFMLPAVCPKHGLFASVPVALGLGAKLTIGNDVTVNCPRCGGPSQIIPGTYEGVSDRIRLLRDANFPLLVLGSLRKLAEQVEAGEIAAADAKKKAEQIHPKAGKLFDVRGWSDQAKATLYASIIGAVAVIAAAKIATSPSQTTVLNPTVIERVSRPPMPLHPVKQNRKPRLQTSRPKGRR